MLESKGVNTVKLDKIGRGKDSGVAWPKWQRGLMIPVNVDTVWRSEMRKLLLNGSFHHYFCSGLRWLHHLLYPWGDQEGEGESGECIEMRLMS